MNDNEKTKHFLQTQQYMIIAVTLADGSPWALPVRIKRWKANIFEWDSKLDSEHSKALAINPTMAITLYEKKFDSQFGVYAKGTGELVEAKEHGLGSYRFIAEEAWINDETFHKRKVVL